jgi:dTMP kinase
MFITLEGPEGSGKTSQINLLAEYIRQQGYDVMQTREPGGTVIGDQIRTVLMQLDNTSMNPRTEILLFCAGRAQHVEEKIRPALAAGKIVLCDRYADSTLAYQGYGHNIDLDTLRRLLDFSTGGLKPELTFLLDIPAEEGLKRRRGSGGEWNRLDAYTLAFHKRVRSGYLDMARNDAARWRIVDASLPFNQVQERLRHLLMAELQNSQVKKK